MQITGLLETAHPDVVAHLAPQSFKHYFFAASAGRGMEATPKKELRKQMVSTVYLEADYGCFFLDVATDTIPCLGAKVAWITAKTREECREGAA